jgi:hypothetical protein
MNENARPIEPNSASENPEQWAAIAAWEAERADRAESARDELLIAVEALDECGCFNDLIEKHKDKA